MTVIDGPWKRERPRRFDGLVAWCIGLAIIAVAVAVGIGIGTALSAAIRWVNP